MNLFPFFFSFIFYTIHAQEQCDLSLKQPYDGARYSSYAVERIFALSNRSPTATNMRANEEYKNAFQDLILIFRDINKVLDDRLQRNDPRACNLDFFQVDWVNITAQTAGVNQIFPIDLRTKCNAQFQVYDKVNDDTKPYRFVERSRSVIVKARSALFNSLSTMNGIPDKTRTDLSWNNGLFELKGWNLRREDQVCVLDRASAYNRNGDIFVTADMTNFPIDLVVEDKKRQVITEYVKDDLSGSLEMIHYDYNTSAIGGKRGCLKKATNILGRWSNKVSLTATGNMKFDDNPALPTALSLNRVSVDISSDSITRSNGALLILPMVMSLIPVAFIAELNTWATFWYIIFTDIFSLIPFAIKGFELIQSSKKSSDVIHVYRSGNSTLGQMEIWVASCQGQRSFRTVGIIFVVLALIFLILGISLEFFANSYMRKQRNLKGAQAEGPFGILLFQQHPETIVEEKAVLQYENKYDEERNRRYSQEEALYRNDTQRSSSMKDGRIQINEFR